MNQYDENQSGGVHFDDGTCFNTNAARPVSGFNTLTNVQKARHDSVKNSINNVR